MSRRFEHLESLGATVNIIAADIGADNASTQLFNALKALSLPPVLGIVHAAGVLEDQLVLETTSDSFHRVLSPKITGALALHNPLPLLTPSTFSYCSPPVDSSLDSQGRVHTPVAMLSSTR